MREIVDKGILIALCLPLLFTVEGTALPAAVFLSALGTACLGGIVKGRARWAGAGLYLAAALIRPEFAVCLPPAVYDLAASGKRALWAAGAGVTACAARCVLSGNALFLLNVLLLGGLAWYLRDATEKTEGMRRKYHRLSDLSRESSMDMEKRNRELAEKRGYEVRLATLNERNRIAREIHDNVGHMLTSAILQVGALSVVNRDERLAGGLETVQDTLSQAMDRIRGSVHGLRDESVDLRTRLEETARRFTFCPVELQIEAEGLRPAVSLCMLAVVSEALTNTARHSNATRATVRVRDFPAFYQLVVSDNGTAAHIKDSGGMGLKSIEERVRSLGGTFSLLTENGFQIYVAIPKEEPEYDACNH